MPSSDRGRSAAALADTELSDWAKNQNLTVSAQQVAGWRRDGLVPQPTEARPRPAGAAPGRRALGYTSATLRQAQQTVEFLAVHGRRGRSHAELAVRLFAAGHPVRHDALLNGLARQLAKVRDEVVAAASRAAQNDTEPGTSADTLGIAESFARQMVSGGAPAARSVRDGLRREGGSGTGDDVTTVLTLLFGTLLGEPPDRDDIDGSALLLRAFGGHGLIEPVYADGPVVVPEGPVGLADAFALAVRQDLYSVPDDITIDELNRARSIAQALAQGFSAVPPELRRHLGGDALTHLWQPDEPLSVALQLTHLVKLDRAALLDVEPIFEAFVQQGWIRTPVPGTEDGGGAAS